MSGAVAGQAGVDGGGSVAAAPDLDARLHAMERALDDLLEYTSDLVHLVDATGGLIAVNRVWRQTLGVGGDTPETSNIDLFLTPERRDAYRAACRKVLADGVTVTLAITFRAWDGRPIEALGRLTRQERAMGAMVCGLFRDVTAQRTQDARLSHVATRDALTNLANRAYLLQHLPLALARARRQRTLVGVVLIDLDRFRNLNDTFGYASGDDALIAVGERLKRSVRAEDLVARLGGDQFVIVLERLHTIADATFVVERALATLTTPLLTHTDAWIRPRASIGVALSAGATDETATLLREAEGAVQQAKRAGGERFVFAARAPQAERDTAPLSAAALVP